MVRFELHSHMPLQGLKCYIPFEWACCLLFATARSLLIKNHRAMDLFSSFKELLIMLFIVTMIQILNMLKCITRYQIRHFLYKSIGGVFQYTLWSASLWHLPSSSILKKKRNVSLVFLKLVHICFFSLTIQLFLRPYNIN